MTNKRVLIINGPNLNLLGKREKDIYGNFTLKQLIAHLDNYSKKCNINLVFFQSNHEGKIIDFIQKGLFNTSGIIINAGALSHTSIAIMDCLQIYRGLIYEVHISNIYSREAYRRKSYISEVSDAIICGLGITGYEIAIDAIIKNVEDEYV